MSKKRFVDTGFWSDVWVVDELDKLERYFFIYLITNDKTNVAGVYEISLRTMANETEFKKEEVRAMLDKMSAKVQYVDGWIVLRKGIKNQNYRNEKIKIAIERALIDCPRKALEYIDFPADFDKKKVMESLQQGKFEFSTGVDNKSTSSRGDMSHTSHMDVSLHSDSDSDFDLDTDINLDSDADAGKPPGFKKNYFRAAEADREQTKRAEKAGDRTGKGYAKAASVAETLRQRRIKPA